MFDKKTVIMAMGGLAVTAIAITVAGVMLYRQTAKIRANMRSISRGVYNFGTALQLLSGAGGGADDTENCVVY